MNNNESKKKVPWILWPFWALWKLVVGIVAGTGRLVAVILGGYSFHHFWFTVDAAGVVLEYQV
jgi:hypothetical protein